MVKSGFNRREFLAAAAALTVVPRFAAGAAEGPRNFRLEPSSAEAPLVGAPYANTPVWAYNGEVPGPLIRIRLGEELRIRVNNRLDQDTTVHWHGLRVPNAMDGVPHLTQPPIPPKGTFDYRFTPPDAGTYWYHPHVRSSEQVGRGLSGALIVEETEPPKVDRDLLWVIDDWRLTQEAAIAEDFGHGMDLSHGGRLGNTVTVNGRLPENVAVRAGERLRLRLINVANARIMALRFEGHDPQIIALDGQPVAPHVPEGGRVVLGPGQRADLMLDMAGDPKGSYAVIDDYYRRSAYKLLDIAYGSEAPVRKSPLDASIALPANPLPEPDLRDAVQHEVVLAGGAMGRMGGAILNGEKMGMRELMGQGKMWALNGIAASDRITTPLLTLQKGRTHVISMVNDTGWPHPMHLHGFAFRLLTRNGKPVPHRPWLDAVLIESGETADVAFVADNPGDWLYHCHILEHTQAGMAAVFRVA